MEILRSATVLWSLINTLFLFMLLCEPRFEKKKYIAITLSAMLPLCIINSALFFMLGSEKMSTLILFTLSIPSLVFFWFTSRKRDGRFFFTFCFVDSISFSIIVFTSLLDFWFGGDKAIILVISRLAVFIVLDILTLKRFRKPYLEIQNSVRKGWGVFSLLSIMFYITVAVMSGTPTIITQRPEDWPVMLMIFAIMTLTYITVFRVLGSQKRLYESQDERRKATKQIELYQNELLMEKDYVERAKQNRHDVRHILQVALDYLEKGNVEDTIAYLSDYKTAIAESSLVTYCENNVVNAMLRLNARRCAQNSISFVAEAVVPQKLPYSNIETGTLFGNLIENAYEAAKNCENPFVEFSSKIKDDVLYVEIRNSVSRDVEFFEGRPISTKPGGGMGVKSAMTILEKYGGMMELFQEGRIFITRIIQIL